MWRLAFRNTVTRVVSNACTVIWCYTGPCFMSKTFARVFRYKWQFFWAGQFIFLESKVTLSVFGCFLVRPCLFQNLPGIRKGQVTVRLKRIHSRSCILFVIRKMFSTLIFSWIHWSPFDRNQWRSQRHRWSSMSLWSHNCSAWANPTKNRGRFPKEQDSANHISLFN